MTRLEARKKLLKSIGACFLAFVMILTNVLGAVEVYAAAIPAPTVNPVLIGSTTISGDKVYKTKVQVGKKKQTVIATVHVTLKDKNGKVKADFPSASISSKNWSVNLPEGVEVAEGDTVTVYQHIGEDKSPEVTENAKDSLANQYKVNLTMPKLEVWSEDLSVLESDAVEDIVKAFKEKNNELEKVDGKIFEGNLDTKKGIDVASNGKSLTVNFSDGSKIENIDISDKVTVKEITEQSNPAEVKNLTVVDGEIKGKISGDGPFKKPRVTIVKFNNEDSKNTYCESGKCTVDKDATVLATIYVDETTGEFTYKVTDNKLLTLGQDIGITVKEYRKKNNCKTIQPSLVIPNVPVRDPKKLTKEEKDKIRKEIRKANTVGGTSKLPDGTGFNGIPAYIDIDDQGNVKIYSGNAITGKTEDGTFVPDRDKKGNVKIKSGNTDIVTSVNPDKLITNLAPKPPKIGYDKTNGEITVTPDKADTDAKKVVVEYQDPDGNKKTETVEKGDDGKWKVVVPEDSTEQPKIKVDENTGVVTIKDSDVKNKTNVSATVTDEGGIAANDKDAKKSENGSEQIKIYPKKPAITVDGTTGDVTITPVDKDGDKVAKKMDITYTPVGKDETKTVTVERKDDGTWTVPEGTDFKVSEGGKSITITNDKIKSKTDITAKTNDGDANETLYSDPDTKNVPDKTAPQPPKVEVNTTDGTAHITPPSDPDTKTIEVKYPGADGDEKTFTATKKGPNTWEITGTNGESIDVQTGKITIPYEKLKKADTISATATDEVGNQSTEDIDTSLPPAPTAKQNEGVITVTPPTEAAVNGMEITYTPAGETDAKTLKVVKGNDSKWKIEGQTPEGVTIDETSGVVTFENGKAEEKTKVTAISSIDTNKKSLEKGEVEVPETKAPDAPDVKVQEDGSVTITPKNEGETTVTVTYKDQDGNDKTATAIKGKNGEWTVNGDNGETIEKTTGVITIPAGKTNPGDRVKATATKGKKTSTENNDLTKPAPPTVTPNQTSGDVTITPPTKGNVDGMIIKYKKPDNTDGTIKVKKGEGGTWTFEGDAPEGVEVAGNTGVVTIKKGHAKEKTPVTAFSTIETLQTPDKNQGEKPALVPDKTAPNPPVVKLEDNGNVTVTPPTDEDTTKVTVIYKNADGSQVTVVAKKANNTWTLTGEDGTSAVTNGETIDQATGVITLRKGNYKTGEEVKAYGNDNVDNKSADDAKTPVEVTFDVDGGKQDIDSSILVQGGSYVLPAVYDKQFFPEGKLFAGWQVGSETKQAGETIQVDANTTVKALWKDIEYKVRFDGNTGTGSMAEATVKKGNEYELPANGFGAPSDKQEFVGWQVNGEIKKVGEKITVNANTTVKAFWKDKTPATQEFTVTFNAGGGSGSMTAQKVAKGGTFTLPSNQFTAPADKGEFKTWEVDGQEVAPGTSITVNKDTEVKAVWKNKTPENPPAVEQFTVSFNGNGGSKDMDSKTVAKGSEFTLPANGFTAPAGKEFAGWEVNGEDKKVGDKITVNANTTVKARWKVKGTTPVEPSKPDAPAVDRGDYLILEKVEPTEPKVDWEIGRHYKYLYGYPDGTVHPEGQITRAEAAGLIARLAELDLSNKAKPNFKDTPSRWYNSAINVMVEKNLMFADKNGNFRPNEPITRGEFARALYYIDKKNNVVAPFADVKGHEFEAAINQAYGNGRIAGYPDGSFRPDAYIQRAEAARMLNQYADRSVSLEGMAGVKKDVIRFTDINESHWAYYEVMEAANTHDYRRAKGTLPETWVRIIQKDGRVAR